MAAASIQIGGGTDVFARYKRPALSVKHEGKGNGVKTILSNIEVVATKLHVDVKVVTAFLAQTIGSSVHIDGEARYSLRGTHTIGALEARLHEFEKIFVTCPKCGVPELIYRVLKESLIYDCRACGGDGPLAVNHKFSRWWARLLRRAKVPVVAPLQTPAPSNENHEVVWNTDTSSEAQAKRIGEEVNDAKVARTTFNDILTRVAPTEAGFAGVWRWFDERKMPEVLKQLKEEHALLGVLTKKHSQVFLKAFEVVPAHHKAAASILEVLYENDVLTEDMITSWYETCAVKTLVEGALPFITWLRTAETED